MTNTKIQTMIQAILQERPGLQRLNRQTPILEYFRPAIEWKQQQVFPYNNLLQDIIISSIERLYGKNLANEAKKHLQESWVIETGAHLHVPRRYNKAAPSNDLQINSLLFQGQVLWACANYKLGRRLTISLNSGRVPLDNTNSGAYLDLPALKNPITLASKKKHPDSPQSLIPARTKEEIQPKMDLLDMYKKQRVLPENQYIMGKQILQNFHDVPSNFSDQVATTHALLLNKVLPITQITLDSELPAIEFLISLLKDPTSLTFSLFDDSEKRERFLTELSNIRTGWTKDSSPFYSVYRTGDGYRLTKYTGDLNPKTLIQGLEQKTLWPTGVMKFFVFMVEAGILPIGGWTQAGYCTEIKTKSEILLRSLGYQERADVLKDMPTHIAAVGPCWGIQTVDEHVQLLDPITAILNPSLVNLSDIMNITAKQTLIIAAPTLYGYLFKKPSPVGYDELPKSLIFK